MAQIEDQIITNTDQEVPRGGEHINGHTTIKGERDRVGSISDGPSEFTPRKSLSDEHIDILDRFKEKVREYELSEEERKMYLDDMWLLRYLRARDYHIERAYKMLIDTIEWRRVRKPDTITLADVEVMARTGCVYINGKDKKGRPIIYARPSREDNLKQPVETETKFNHLMYWVERGFAMMDKSKGVETFTLITDYKNFGRKHMDMKANMEVLGYLNNHCPERMGKTFFLDPPFLFWVGWKVISPFLSQATLNKVNFIKSSSRTDQRNFPEIFEVIDEDVLEEEFGGKNKKSFDCDDYIKLGEDPNYLVSKK